MTAQPAPPASDGARERGDAPPAHRQRPQPRRGGPPVRPVGLACPAAPRHGCGPPLGQLRLKDVSSQSPPDRGATRGKTSRSAPLRISRECRLPLPGRVGRSWRTSTYTTPTRSHSPPSSPPDLTRGHSSREPALRPSPVNGDAERKEPSLYARSAPDDPAANKEGSSDRLANHLGLARPDGPTSRTVALATAHSSRWC